MTAGVARRAALVASAAAAIAHRWPLAAAQPSPPPAAFDEPWFLGAARQGLEVLCCGGMSCLATHTRISRPIVDDCCPRDTPCRAMPGPGEAECLSACQPPPTTRPPGDRGGPKGTPCVGLPGLWPRTAESAPACGDIR